MILSKERLGAAMEFLVWAIFFLILGIYLYFEWNEKRIETQRIKLFLMPLLFLSVFLFAQIRQLYVPFALKMALFLGFLGDVLLFDKNKRSLFIGGVFSFLAGHLLYAWIIFEMIGEANLLLLFFASLIYGVILFFFLKEYDDHSGFFYLYCLYGVVVLSIAVSSLSLLLEKPGLEAFMIFAGAHLFMISDMGILKDFKKPRRWSPVILLYSLGQFLLAMGIVLGSSS